MYPLELALHRIESIIQACSDKLFTAARVNFGKMAHVRDSSYVIWLKINGAAFVGRRPSIQESKRRFNYEKS